MHSLKIGDTCWTDAWLLPEEPRGQGMGWLGAKELTALNVHFQSLSWQECVCIFHGKDGPEGE